MTYIIHIVGILSKNIKNTRVIIKFHHLMELYFIKALEIVHG